MNNFGKYLLINLCIPLIIGFLINNPSKYGRSYGSNHSDLGITLMLMALPMFLIGLIIALAAKEKTYGLSLLTATGLILLIGFGVCTLG
ncbi:MAG: hypothetical protein KA319_07660 [Ferruginibacter sp.]|nr:hypothetical protein [Ferruginibacter sp.]